MMKIDRYLHNLTQLYGYKFTNRLDVMDDRYNFCFYKWDELADSMRLNLRFGPNWYKNHVFLYTKADLHAYAAFEDEMIAVADAATDQYAKHELIHRYGEFFQWMMIKPRPLRKPTNHTK